MSNQVDTFKCGDQCVAAMGTTQESVSGSSVYGELLPTLEKCFGHVAFRPGQVDAILAVLHGQDVFIRMCTGSGKTLCMFLPPLVRSEAAVAVIISPLISLTEYVSGIVDLVNIIESLRVYRKVQKLQDRCLTAICVSDESSYKDVASGRYRFGMLISSHQVKAFT